LLQNDTSPHQWKFVDGKTNPADDASRGLDTNRFTDQQRWITGPEFLWKSEETWPECPP